MIAMWSQELNRHRRLATTVLGGNGAGAAPGSMGRPAPRPAVALCQP